LNLVSTGFEFDAHAPMGIGRGAWIFTWHR